MAKSKKQQKNEEIKRTDILISGNQATWQVNHQGAVLGLYTGTFTFRCFLSPLQYLAASRYMRELIGAHPELLTETERYMAFAIAQLRHRVISAPPWWSSIEADGEFPDYDVITAVMNAATDSETMFYDAKMAEKANILKRSVEAAEKILAQTKKSEKADEEEPEKDAE